MQKLVSDRIKLIIKALDLNNNSFSKAIGLTNNVTIGRIVNENREPSYDVLQKIIQTFGSINANWLLTGAGNMFIEVTPNLQSGLSKKMTPKVTPVVTANPITLINLEPSKNLIHIPITDISVAAGDGAFNNDTIEIMDTIQLPKSLLKSGTYLCVRVKGNSMSPTMHDGGYAVIRLIDKGKWIEAKDEQVYVISNMEGKAYIKRLKMRLKQGFVVCMSDNPDKNAYSNFNLLIDEINTIWHVEWYFTAKLPNIHSTYYSKVTDLEDEMWEIKQQLNQVLNRLS